MPRDTTGDYDLCMDTLVRAYIGDGLKLDVDNARKIVAAFGPSVERAIFAEGLLACMRIHEARKRAKPMDNVARARIAASRRRAKANLEYCRLHRIHLSELAQHKLKNALAIVEENKAKAAKYDKVVELLDNWIVDGVRLGECTKEKLMSAAAKREALAADLTNEAEIYKRLASHMRDGETVRKSTRRETVLDILCALKA